MVLGRLRPFGRGLGLRQFLPTVVPGGRRMSAAGASAAAAAGAYRLTPEDHEFFDANGYLIVRNFLQRQEVDLLREALETDQSLRDQQIQLNDQNKGQTKFALWSNPGDGTLGRLTRSRRVVETVEAMMGGPVLHYHSKNLVKYPEEGGVWNWHQDYGCESLSALRCGCALFRACHRGWLPSAPCPLWRLTPWPAPDAAFPNVPQTGTRISSSRRTW